MFLNAGLFGGCWSSFEELKLNSAFAFCLEKTMQRRAAKGKKAHNSDEETNEGTQHRTEWTSSSCPILPHTKKQVVSSGFSP